MRLLKYIVTFLVLYGLFVSALAGIEVSLREENQDEQDETTEIEEVVIQEIKPVETRPVFKYEERYTQVPFFIQQDYPKNWYGGYGTISTHGCGICSVAMVFTYLLDEVVEPVELANKYASCNTEHGSSWTLFTRSAEDYGIEEPRQCRQWDEVYEALKAGHLVIACENQDSIFTDGGHFIVLTGLTEEGKVLVKDPNIYNYPNKHNQYGEWLNATLLDGLVPVGLDLKSIDQYATYADWLNSGVEAGYTQQGFDVKHMKHGCYVWWIYPKKDFSVIAEREREVEMTKG